MLKDLAADFGMDRSHCRRYVLGLGITPKKVRTRDAGNQLALAVTKDEAGRIRDARLAEGFSVDGGRLPVDTTVGYFYVIRPDPDGRPNRLKMGFSNNVQARCATFRTVCPNAEVLVQHACLRTWELAIIDAMECMPGVSQVNGGEVHDCEDVEGLLIRLEKLFGFFKREGT